MKKILLLLTIAGIITYSKSQSTFEKKGSQGVEMYVTQTDIITKDTHTQHIKAQKKIQQTINLAHDINLVVDFNFDDSYDHLWLHGSLTQSSGSQVSFNGRARRNRDARPWYTGSKPWNFDWNIIEFTYHNSVIRIAFRNSLVGYSSSFKIEKYLHETVKSINLTMPKMSHEPYFKIEEKIIRPLEDNSFAQDRFVILGERSDSGLTARFLMSLDENATSTELAKFKIIDPESRASNFKLSVSQNTNLLDETIELKLNAE